ncbi:VWA domain-containing protein [Halorussus sp. GCM10023401]|uniref:VWA domain-containing protein n=1 Tax=Halorussus sp. GCM10023401 TaxID=3252680 RepID=UPI0036163A9C
MRPELVRLELVRAVARRAAVPGVSVPGFDATVEFARPAVLAALPVAAVVLGLLVLRRGGGRAATPDAGAGRRARIALLATRTVVVACLVVAAAGPTTVTTATTPGDPTVTMLVDRSASTDVYPSVADDLEAAIESEGVAVDRVRVAAGNRSRVGDGLLANLRPNGSVLVVSDGRVTGGASLARAADVAESVDATVNRVRLTPNRTDRRVAVFGPSKVSVGVENRFAVRVSGVESGESAGGGGEGANGGAAPTGATVTIEVDGSVVDSRPVPENGTVSVTRNFSSVGPHRITARLNGDDVHAANDVYRKTVQAVERPRVLYVSRGDYALEEYLRRLYDVERVAEVPEDLGDYYAVVVHDVAAPDLGSVGALQKYVIDGGGLVVVGGEHAYEKGGYGSSQIASMLPVRVGGSTGRRSQVVLAVDVSGSAKSGMRVQKSLALDVLDQLGGQNRVGLVAFNRQAYRVANLTALDGSRADLERKIRSLRSGGGTNVARGLLGASNLLGDRGGTVVLLSDGRDAAKPSFAAADRLESRDVRVVTVGVGSVNAKVLRGIAERTGGTFLPADETNRLRVEFGGPNRRYDGDHLVVVDDGHFVTRGVDPTASLPGSNEVGVKAGANLLAATGYGAPALSAWRFGLGRVVAVTAYGADGSLGGLRTRPASLLLSRSVNWAVGDPQRKATGVVSAPDTRVGRPTRLVYAGEERPSVEGISFSKVAADRYEARPVPDARGYRDVLGSSFAVNYRAEYAALGVSPALKRAVERTGGETFGTRQASAIADAVTQQTTHRRRIERRWDWALLLAGLVVYVGEVCARRLGRYRGRGAIP